MNRSEPTFDSTAAVNGPPPPETPTGQPAPDTYCTYLARQFIAKKGFDLTGIPETERLHEACDIVLARSDGYSFGLLCMVDREARPDAAFGMGVDELEAVGRSCLQYAGSVNGRKLPVSIAVMEVGPTAPDQIRRLQSIKRASLFAKVLPSSMAVDTVTREVTWSNGGGIFSKGIYRRFVRQILAAPREADADLQPPTVVVAAPSFAWLTTAILLALAAVFAGELGFGIGPWTGLLQPSSATLLVFGGLAPTLVLQDGEWYRLFSAPLLHADATHIVMNGLALFLAGRVLEALIGRAWFGAIYAVGALAGSLLSLALNSAALVSVGASGAIMGLFAAMMVVSGHFPTGSIRTTLQINALYVLLPSLLPLAGVLNGHRVDYAAHFGGAIAGAAIGFVLLRIWSKDEPLAAFNKAAAAIACGGLLALVYPALAVTHGYQAVAELIPPDKFPASKAALKAHEAELIADYPNDPRPRLFRAADLLDAGDALSAERQARAGLAHEQAWRSMLSPDIADSLRAILAIAIAETHPEEALATARPLCASRQDWIRSALGAKRLCGS